MKYSKILIVSMAVLLTGGVSLAQSMPETIYVTNEISGEILVMLLDAGEYYVDDSIFISGHFFFDVVYGPDKMLYAFGVYASGGVGESEVTYFGKIVRIDPVSYAYTTLHDGAVGPPRSPTTGWFTHNGELVVADSFNTAGTDLENSVWIFPPEGAPYEVLTPAYLPDNFGGIGITQAADGDLLFTAFDVAVDSNGTNGRVLKLPYITDEGFDPIEQPVESVLPVQPFSTPLIGLARLSRGDIYVSTLNTLYGYSKEPGEGGGIDWDPYCSIGTNGASSFSYVHPDTGALCTGVPMFFEVAADDTIYIATSDTCESIEYCWEGCSVDCDECDDDDIDCWMGCCEDSCDDETCDHCIYVDEEITGSIWAIGTDDGCYRHRLPVDFGDFNEAPLLGLAVTPTGTAPLDILPGPPNDDGSEDYFFSFNDHVLELTTPEECTVALVEARETPKSCLDEIIADHIEYNGDLDATPVLYLGDKAFGQTYYIEGPPGVDACPGVGDDGTFRYAVSAYTEDLFNPRIIRCDVSIPAKALSDADICYPVTGDLCEVIDLASFFPGEGVLPDDGRIAGTRSSTADFSQYFVVDSGPNGYSGEGETGCACGFRPPVHNVDEPDDPYRSVFREGRSVPFKVRFTDGECDDGMCQGNYIAPSGVLLSIARLADENGPFDEIDFVCQGNGCGSEPYFRDPKGRNSGYHMNVRTDSWDPGTYIATVTVTNSGLEDGDTEYVVPVLVTYFDIIP